MLELLVLTAVRSGEIRGMERGEIDLETAVWTIPASRMKAKVAHRVPLAPRAVAILKLQRDRSGDGRLVFPSQRGTPLSDMTLTKLLRDAKVASDVPGRSATAHGFRSAFRDWASENGYPRELAERALAHTIRNSTEAAYHRTDLLDARRKMMEAWAKYVGQSLS
jgi:integrase